MGFWQVEYEENGWSEYVSQVLSGRYGDTAYGYEVSDEDKRQVQHLLAMLDDDASADDSYVYHTPTSDLSFEYNTPGPQKKKKRPGSNSKMNHTSFFPDFDSKELEVDDDGGGTDRVASSLCQRLADMSPITNPVAETIAQKLDFDAVRTLSFDGPAEQSTNCADDGNGIIVAEDNSSGVFVTAHNAQSTLKQAVPDVGIDDIFMDEQIEQFEELEVQPVDDLSHGVEWTMLLDHFDIMDNSDKESSPGNDVPTQRRQFDDDVDLPTSGSPPRPKPIRRRLRVPDSDSNHSDSSEASFGAGDACNTPIEADTLPKRLQRFHPLSACSDISSFDDLHTLSVPDTPRCSTVESTAALDLARMSAVTPLTLLGHQQHAVEWMQMRERPSAKPFRGGILADEMGLGKSVCCLALIAKKAGMVNYGRKKKRPTLIITPLSLVHQWEQEIKEKTTLSVGVYHGANRKRFLTSHDLYAFDIILTTYDTLRLKEATYTRPTMTTVHLSSAKPWIQTKRRRDGKPLASKLHKVYWERVVLDEAHLISNSITARAQAACQLSACARWCVTGTPIQNRLDDVYTLFRFLGLPAVESEEHLNELLNQCMLRRLKDTLPIPLPAKTEHLIKLDFQTDIEKAWYANVRQSTREQVHQHMQARRPGRHIFELLLRLRQVCNSPRLLPRHQSLPIVHMSTKMQVLFDHLQRAKHENAPVLVISQWTSFLDLIEEQLDATNPSIRCIRLDGHMSAANRNKAVQLFQSSNVVDVMLMSLRCGALGLNLTNARRVFLMEPCWNPSMEAQAVDRTHRIGQADPVHVFRFLMQNTIEDKIYELQQQKRDLASNVLNSTRKKPLADRRTMHEWVALVA
ncbi:hypothetical protein H310_06131 [Aphanomyces invadans]|uniref:Helicase C-terminal domain-containing protein n=1 Tax=Aphanomyces invadans TaxID=157072 RepID=A0A024U8Y3_9STRA|nr:hypothetical protein H310_06131 [Aphanomyces invadans]ETW02680.1 hypothetical protein H310_06131 [Aphanomyces invadans]|eukprot:XP_008869285.1 hypothetical protein H310_06131 [Aphanomyces invadans]